MQQFPEIRYTAGMESRDATILPDDIALNPQFRDKERALLHALLQATDYGILLSGLDRQDIMANRRLGELFGMAPQEIVVTDPEVVRELARARVRDPQAFEAQLRRTYADPALTYEDEVELATEPPRTLRRYTGPVCDAEGHPIARLWTFLDITETKRLQAEVQAQLVARTADFHATSEVLQAMNDLCRVAVQRRNEDELLLAIAEIVRPLIDHECSALFLLSEEGTELHGVACPVNSPAKLLRLTLQRDTALARAIEKGRDAGETPLLLFTNYNGQMARQLHCKTVEVAPLRSEGRVIGTLVMGHASPDPAFDRQDQYRTAHIRALVDQIVLTLETHRLQSELHTAMQSLQATQQRMVEMEKLRSAGALAAGIAHDIRNILAAMEMEIEAESEHAGPALQDQLNRFSALTHRLLAFSRPSVLETRPTSVTGVIERIVPLIAGQAEICGVEIVMDLLKDDPQVAADASQLEHLFVNLCLNAIQAMTERGGTLTLTSCLRQRWLEIEIRDTGNGIASEVIARVFEPFFTTRATGFGLGLFSCKRIVEEHGGQLSVQSEPGQGACFTVLLPILRV